jgi:hypothetical protein
MPRSNSVRFRGTRKRYAMFYFSAKSVDFVSNNANMQLRLWMNPVGRPHLPGHQRTVWVLQARLPSWHHCIMHIMLGGIGYCGGLVCGCPRPRGSHTYILHPFQIVRRFVFFRYITFTTSKCITKSAYLEKPKSLIIWDGGSTYLPPRE